jgi:tetratricopeptide (TPR) repeat protein
MTQGPSPRDRERILDSLERIERSKGFRRSLRMTRFLRFIVEGALEGRIDDLRESVLGIEVFDRGGSFDPSTDNIVRVDAARLRSKLADYYANEGADEPVRITMPKGGYVPEFETGAKRAASAARPLCERGFRHLRRRTAAEIAKARSAFEAASLDDPGCACALAGFAACRVALVELGYGPAPKLLEEAAAKSREALALDARFADAFVTLGTVDLLLWSPAEAEKRARDAMRIDPESAGPRALLGRILAVRGKEEDALEELERAVGLDPNDERARQSLGWELCMQDDCEQALQQAHAAAYFEPGLHGPHVLAASAYCAEEAWGEALAELEQAGIRAPGNPWTQALQAYAFGRSGSAEASRALVDELAGRTARGEVSRVCVAAARLGGGDDPKADLEAAFGARDPQLELLRLPLFGQWRKRRLPLSWI